MHSLEFFTKGCFRKMFLKTMIFSRKKRESRSVDSLIIEGIHIDDFQRPLSKIWAALKKQIIKNYGVAVTATFSTRPNHTVVCDFITDGAFLEKEQARGRGVDIRLYEARFVDSSEQWIAEFEDYILAYIDDTENGLSAFLSEGKAPEVFNSHMTSFLVSVGLIDEKERERRKKVENAREDRKRRRHEAKANAARKAPKKRESDYGWR